jgi:hypothetical protein
MRLMVMICDLRLRKNSEFVKIRNISATPVTTFSVDWLLVQAGGVVRVRCVAEEVADNLA